MQLSFEYLPADLFGLGRAQRAALAGSTTESGRSSTSIGWSVPRRLDAIPFQHDRFALDERAQLVEAWEAAIAPLEPHVAVLDALRSLREPGASIVIATHRPCLLGGPLHGVYQAIHSVRLARVLSERWKRPVVPVAWNDADDCDAEATQQLTFVNENLDLRRVSLPGMTPERSPLSRLALDPARHHLGPITELVRELLPRTSYREDALNMFLPRVGESLARAYSRSMTALLGHLGLVLIEPDWLREDLSRALARLIADDPAPALSNGAHRLRALDDAVTLDPTREPLAYRLAEEELQPLRSGGDGFRYDGEAGSRTPSELAAEILQEPDAWCAGALLLPLIQDLVLPVAVRVGGWEEWVRLAGVLELREVRDLPAPPFVPRASCTLIDGPCATALTRLGLTVREWIAGGGRDPGTDGDQPDLAAHLRDIAGRAARELLDTRAALARLDPGLAGQLKRTAGDLRGLVEKLATRAGRVHRNRSGTHRRNERRVRSHILPRGLPQEQVLGVLPFVAQFGPDWIERLLEELDPIPLEHLVVRLDGDRPAASAPPD
jgi:uncharacterized protein YllA (UPF0747 family)